jgi:hypothetical protein
MMNALEHFEMALDANKSLTPAQRKERAIQWLVRVAFIAEFSDQPNALLEAAARVMRARNGGAPLSKTAAGNHCRLLRDALSDDGED